MRITERHLDDFVGGFPAPASENNRYPRIENNDWTAGFYTGILWMCYEYSGKKAFYDAAMGRLQSFRSRIENRVVVDHHDMGFIYSLSCVAAYKLTGCLLYTSDEVLENWDQSYAKQLSAGR